MLLRRQNRSLVLSDKTITVHARSKEARTSLGLRGAARSFRFASSALRFSASNCANCCCCCCCLAFASSFGLFAFATLPLLLLGCALCSQLDHGNAESDVHRCLWRAFLASNSLLRCACFSCSLLNWFCDAQIIPKFRSVFKPRVDSSPSPLPQALSVAALEHCSQHPLIKQPEQ